MSAFTKDTSAPFKLYYFNIPALGEPIRQLLTMGGYTWEDIKVSGKPDTFDAYWPDIKPTTRWGQMPMLVFPDGKKVCQTKAIVRYLARTTFVGGKALYPDDAEEAMMVDEMIDAFEDIRGAFLPSFFMKDQAEKEAARKAIFGKDGKGTQILTIAESMIKGSFMMGEQMTLADLWVFWFFGFTAGGFLDGLDASVFEPYTKLIQVCKNVGKIPALQKLYEGRDGMYSYYADLCK
jgi:glutathione S-transferase